VDTEEMYRRGVADAERDDLNTFYYQHYYPYRRGYDEMRRRLRRPGISLRRRFPFIWLIVLVIGAAGAWYVLQREQTKAPPPTPTVVAQLPTRTALPTRTPIFPTITPIPISPTPILAVELQIGNQAVVVTGGLRARRDPRLASPITASFREGDRVKIIEGPREADGYMWWRVENKSGRGWSAQRSLEGVDWLRPSES